VLTEPQVALEKAKTEKEGTANWRASARAIAGPRHVYVGKLKGVGRIYQQAFIDAYVKVAFPKLMIARRRSPRRICSMTESCRSSRSTISSCCDRQLDTSLPII
jgi:hypothetical protein